MVEEDAPGQHHTDQVYIRPPVGLHGLGSSGLHNQLLHHVVIAQHAESLTLAVTFSQFDLISFISILEIYESKAIFCSMFSAIALSFTVSNSLTHAGHCGHDKGVLPELSDLPLCK